MTNTPSNDDLSLEDLAERLAHLRAPTFTIHTEQTRALAIHWQMLKLDVLGSALSGNKLFKLLPFLLAAKQQRKSHLISFGGAYSNHLYALAAAGQHFGFQVTAVVRGYAQQPETATLADLRRMGAAIHFADKVEYARRYDEDYHVQLAARYPQALIINEGGAGHYGIEGAKMIAQVIANSVDQMPDNIVLATGTGTSFAGLLENPVIPENTQIMAIAALHNIAEIEQLVKNSQHKNYRIIDGFQCGGFAKLNPALARYMVDFEHQQQILLDPIYTAKMCFAIDTMIHSGNIPSGSSVLCIHTGGLQGRRGLEAKVRALAVQAS